ncbi:MAG: glycine cleavage system protein GcvH [Candidatus Gastranaerophilales bacterium]|nr:glycine cleavage system protein GcvH [Candidatus Gastranaerophilales bacterium]
MTVTDNILCSKSHEYVYEKDGKYVIGLTDYAIEQLGDIVFVDLPEIGTEFSKGDILGTIESVKAASEIYIPISGTIEDINEELIEKPELMNEQPFDEVWLVKLSSASFVQDSNDLIDYKAYKAEME